MGVGIRWFNHDRREYIQTGHRWAFAGHPASCLLYVFMRGPWNGGKIAAYSDHDGGNEFFDLAGQYRDVTQEAEAELRTVGCWCVPGQTPDDTDRGAALASPAAASGEEGT